MSAKTTARPVTHRFQHQSIGSGTLAFGLVSVNVKVYAAAESDRDISAHMLHKGCSARLKQELRCSACGDVVTASERVKGYDIAGQTVVLTDDEARRITSEGSGGIEIVETVPAVSPLYLSGSAYYLSPEDEAFGRAYDVVSAALREARLVAIARWTWRGRTRPVAISPDERGVLVMHALHYGGALRDSGPLVVERPEPTSAEVSLAVQLLRSLQSDAYCAESYRDDAADRLRAELERRAAGAPVAVAETPALRPVRDLMDALKSSLAAAA